MGCGKNIQPEMKQESVPVQRIVDTVNKPKSRQLLEVYGGLYIKVPTYAMKQCDIPYLCFSYETHFTNVLARYEKLVGKIKSGGLPTSGAYNQYEQWARINPQYVGEYPVNNVTVRNWWLRPSSFYLLQEEDCALLKKKFPDGCKVVMANDILAEAKNEDLDDHWTLTKNPLSDYLQHDPLGMLLTSIQDITNDIVSLVLQTIEHGISQAFVDPGTLNFDAYRQAEVMPGSIYPARAKSGKSLSDSFYELRTATLSAEILPFSEWINSRGQLVSGAVPALFGGQNISGSKTASEFSMSRAQAQQRLGTPWKMFIVWWKQIFSKAIPAYIKTVMEDERLVQQDEQGNYVNVYIRKAELQGKIGSVELEASDQLPVTWAQKKDVIVQLMQSQNPQLMQYLFNPENLPLISEALGLTDFDVPGESDRAKQIDEIQLLLNSEPISNPLTNPMDGSTQYIEDASVEVDPILDNHAVEAETCRHWLLSDAGRQARTQNPNGYRNVLLHFKAHMSLIPPPMGATPPENPQQQEKVAPPAEEPENA